MYRKRKQAYHYFNETAPCDEIIQPEIETIPAVDENVIKSLIPIISTKHENEEVQGVDARQLHEFLGSKQDFSTWIKSRIEQYDFMQGIDFIHTPQIYGTSTGAVKRDEYTLTIEMAKELSMVERTERGKQARKYFIECEKIAKGQLTTTAVQTADIVPAQPIQPAPQKPTPFDGLIKTGDFLKDVDTVIELARKMGYTQKDSYRAADAAIKKLYSS